MSLVFQGDFELSKNIFITEGDESIREHKAEFLNGFTGAIKDEARKLAAPDLNLQ